MSENPLAATAVVTADGPGIENILRLFFIHSFTRIKPGSEIPGVPASDISEINSPNFQQPRFGSSFGGFRGNESSGPSSGPGLVLVEYLCINLLVFLFCLYKTLFSPLAS